MLLNAISNSIQNTYLIDVPNIANIIYDYVDTDPKCFVINTDTGTTRDFYNIDSHEFIGLPNENKTLFNSYMDKLQEIVFKNMGCSDEILYLNFDTLQ